MKNKYKNNNGFTLVELLVVIAIIGILSSIAIVNLNSARDKAKTASTLSSFTSLLPVVALCFDDGEELNTPISASAGTLICASSKTTWPILDNGYVYTAFASTIPANFWYYKADHPNLINIGCSSNPGFFGKINNCFETLQKN